MGNNFNVFLITFDSCRWDTFDAANLPTLKSLSTFKRAYAQATFTLPSHTAMFSGIFPHVFEQVPYYNRFVKNIFRFDEKRESLFYLPSNSKNIIDGLKDLGYDTFGTGAVEWFKSPILTESFDDFFYSGIYANQQIDWILDKIKHKTQENFLGFINLGETHEPYEYGGFVQPSTELRQKMRKNYPSGFLNNLFEKQISCVEFLDKALEKLFNNLPSNSRNFFIICSDHGECFGEDGLYGHGFYHPKIMEVPFSLFTI